MVNYDLERGVSVTTIKGSSSVPSHPILGSSTGSTDYDIVPNVVNGGVGGKVGSKSKDQSTKSRLIITEANPQDSGNYTCKPSNAVPASIQVFVSKNRGKYFILMQSNLYLIIVVIINRCTYRIICLYLVFLNE